MCAEMLFVDRQASEIDVSFERERVNDAEFARLLRDIDELSAWFRARGVIEPGVV